MSIVLGNLSIREMEIRLGTTFSDEAKAFMEASHQDKADNIAEGKWHCFDIPFVIICGDLDTAQKIYDYLRQCPDKFKESVQIATMKRKEMS